MGVYRKSQEKSYTWVEPFLWKSMIGKDIDG
jgi:hypothetical protein